MMQPSAPPAPPPPATHSHDGGAGRLESALSVAAVVLGVTVVGEGRRVFGGQRSIGCQVRDRDGEYWLRVISEPVSWAHGQFWEGNATAAGIEGVAKPAWLASHEWEQSDRRFKAELMSLVTAPVCSATAALRSPVGLPDSWWQVLRCSLDALAGWPTTRVSHSQDLATRRLLASFGDRLDPVVREWTTAHGDLHWANLTAPDCWLLDWETWGRAPAGYDAAMLYCTSLLHPETAGRVYDTFADVLETPEGTRAQVCAAAKLLLRAHYGHDLDLAVPLHRHVDRLLTRRRRGGQSFG